LWCRRGKAFSERPFALRRQQPENDKQKADIAPSWKNLCGRPCTQASGISSFKSEIKYNV